VDIARSSIQSAHQMFTTSRTHQYCRANGTDSGHQPPWLPSKPLFEQPDNEPRNRRVVMSAAAKRPPVALRTSRSCTEVLGLINCRARRTLVMSMQTRRPSVLSPNRIDAGCALRGVVCRPIARGAPTASAMAYEVDSGTAEAAGSRAPIPGELHRPYPVREITSSARGSRHAHASSPPMAPVTSHPSMKADSVA